MADKILYVFDSDSEEIVIPMVKDETTTPMEYTNTSTGAKVFDDSVVNMETIVADAQAKVTSTQRVVSGNPTTPPPSPF